MERIDFADIPDLVGITTMTATAAHAYEIADRYRELGAKVVLGGIHASLSPRWILASHCSGAVPKAAGAHLAPAISPLSTTIFVDYAVWHALGDGFSSPEPNMAFLRKELTESRRWLII